MTKLLINKINFDLLFKPTKGYLLRINLSINHNNNNINKIINFCKD